MEDGQLSLFGEEVTDAAWKNYWQSMPEFQVTSEESLHKLIVHFRNVEDLQEFAKLIGQRIVNPHAKQKQIQSLWYPEAEIGRYADKRYVGIPEMNPQYPVYIISKGRADSRMTSRALEAINVPYRIVVEPQEYDEYAEVIDSAKILTLPFSNLGQGSIPARNWVWEHSVEEGHKRHWILDDNIRAFYRFNRNLKVPVSSGNIFRAAEDWADRYENMVISGFQYFMFVARKSMLPPFVMNTRVYSCILIQNDLEHRWRGRYNEDTDLCIRALKDGLCTCLFNVFLAEKTPTMTMGGGNTKDLYEIEDGRYKMAEALREQHPDIVTNTRKWNRWQHYVDYSGFKNNRPIPRPGAPTADEVNNFGMRLEAFDKEADRGE
jgi:TET-Associated Glycosyltransferase